MSPENCRLDGCENAARARGLCGKHYKAESRAGRRQEHAVVERPALTYKQAHERIYRRHGSASLYRCVTCNGMAEEWSYRGGAPDEQPSDRGPFSGDPSFYEPRCVACHRRFDGLGDVCRKGHRFTPENTYEWNGRRFCRQCRNENARERWMAKT